MIELRKNVGEPERALLVGAYPNNALADAEDWLDELQSLVEAADGRVVGRTVQRRSGGDRAIDPRTYVGKGKAQHIAELVEAHEANLVCFDNELSPAQVRELETLIGCRVIDRSELILDIFASRAKTREARLQVELAQLQYTAPRLRGMWTHLERQQASGGSVGIGTRGPGEKQIEIDRRIVDNRITGLRRELADIHARKQREVKHRSSHAFLVGLVGYTNAGKSTLMNAMTDANTYSADRLFATLDTKTRRWHVGHGVEVLLSDTVGFVRNLPHQLVASFRATLEEALSADLLLHVVDASHKRAQEQIETVDKVLRELGCDFANVLTVLNKSDAVADPDDLLVLRAGVADSVSISARRGDGLADLTDAVHTRFARAQTTVDIAAPVDSGALQAFLRSRAAIETESWEEAGWRARAVVPNHLVARLRELCPDASLTLVPRPEAV